MKLLLTSGGIKNPSIRTALVDLLPRPIEECDALGITTASYGHPMAGPGRAWAFVADDSMTALPWKSLGLLELSALPSLGKDVWLPWVERADVFLVNGGDAAFLAHWLRESGLADVLPSLDAVWCGLSAGSMVMTPRIGPDFVHWPADGGPDEALGIVDFAIFPHLDNPDLPHNTMATAEEWAAGLGGIPAYAIDDETALRWVDGEVEVVSEGNWHFFEPPVN